jgi:rsbT antagonist protein RsbS
VTIEHIPILKMGDYLLVTIQVEMHDRLALALQDELTKAVARTGARGVLIDISALDMVDSFLGRMLSTIAAMTKMLDAETVVVGMQPAIAITLVEMGLNLPGVLTALDVGRGMELLKRSLKQSEGEGAGVNDCSTVDDDISDG